MACGNLFVCTIYGAPCTSCVKGAGGQECVKKCKHAEVQPPPPLQPQSSSSSSNPASTPQPGTSVGDPGARCKHGVNGLCRNPNTCAVSDIMYNKCNGGPENVCCLQQSPEKANSPPPPSTYAVGKGGQARRTPIIDQHKLNHWNNANFCGIATLIGALIANGKSFSYSSSSDIEALSKGIYIPGEGTIGAGIAMRMREYGIPGSTYTREGTLRDMTRTVDAGNPCPIGVMSMSGTVVRFGSAGRSERYPSLRIGSEHNKQYDISGHWTTAVGYDGSPTNPSAIYLNDPDTGARLKLTKSQFLKSAEDNGIWLIKNDDQAQSGGNVAFSSPGAIAGGGALLAGAAFATFVRQRQRRKTPRKRRKPKKPRGGLGLAKSDSLGRAPGHFSFQNPSLHYQA